MKVCVSGSWDIPPTRSLLIFNLANIYNMISKIYFIDK